MDDQADQLSGEEAVERFVEELETQGTVNDQFRSLIEKEMGNLKEKSLERIQAAIATLREQAELAKKKLTEDTHTAMEQMSAAIERQLQSSAAPSSSAPAPAQAAPSKPKTAEPSFLQGQAAFFMDPKVKTSRKLFRASAILSGAYLALGFGKWIVNKARGVPNSKPGIFSKFLNYTGLAALAGAGVSFLSEKLGTDTSADENSTTTVTVKPKKKRATGKPGEQPSGEEAEEAEEPEDSPELPGGAIDLMANEAELTNNGNTVSVNIEQDAIIFNGTRYKMGLTEMAHTMASGILGNISGLKISQATWAEGKLSLLTNVVYVPKDETEEVSMEYNYEVPEDQLAHAIYNGALGSDSFVMKIAAYGMQIEAIELKK